MVCEVLQVGMQGRKENGKGYWNQKSA